MPDEDSVFKKHYSEESFWDKLKNMAQKSGLEVVEKALMLYYALQRPETPTWAKSIIIGALGYFIFPLDAIPDTILAAGYTDDLGVLAAALATVGLYVNDEVKAKARQKVKDWFD